MTSITRAEEVSTTDTITTTVTTTNIATASTTVLSIATRIHLGNASTAPPQSKLNAQIESFLRFASSVAGGHDSSSSCSSSYEVCVGIAVDTEEKIEGYDLFEAVSNAVAQVQSSSSLSLKVIQVLPVSPWGNFVFALNALLAWSISSAVAATRIMYVSLETTLTSEAVRTLCRHVDDDATLVAGAKLPGHTHTSSTGTATAGAAGATVVVPLDGRTTPWNTAAVWNTSKLILTGFPFVGEGGIGSAGGVEEVPTIALLQKILTPERAQAKLIQLAGVEWEQDFSEDEGRRRWHESKMASKIERAAVHLERLQLGGLVWHL